MKKIFTNVSMEYRLEMCIRDRNEDECYCLLSAALFAHIGFGLNQEIMNRYVDKLGIQKQAEELTFFPVMSKYHVLFLSLIHISIL